MKPSARRRLRHPAAGTESAPGTAPEVRALSSGVGYVMVPAFGSIDSSRAPVCDEPAFRACSRGSVCESAGWIVDLRQDGGGNMWPMLAGLQPFLGTGVLGYFQGPSRERATLARRPGIPGGTGLAGESRLGSSRGADRAAHRQLWRSGDDRIPRTPADPVVRPPDRWPGQCQPLVPLPDGGMMALMTAVDVDREGIVYGHKVDPDVTVPDGENGTDAALNAATSWVRAKSGCKSSANPRCSSSRNEAAGPDLRRHPPPDRDHRVP